MTDTRRALTGAQRHVLGDMVDTGAVTHEQAEIATNFFHRTGRLFVRSDAHRTTYTINATGTTTARAWDNDDEDDDE